MILAEIEAAVREMCDLEERGEYRPFLEADLSAFLFHLFLKNSFCDLGRVHLDTRVIGAQNDNTFFDIVIGEVQPRHDGRPAISPETIIEIKMFPCGFTDQEHRVHFEHILNNDLRKLGSFTAQTATTIEFIFDHVDYLSGIYSGKIRESVIVKKRDSIAPATKLVFARKIAGNWRTSVK